jgi:hypothetical protein
MIVARVGVADSARNIHLGKIGQAVAPDRLRLDGHYDGMTVEPMDALRTTNNLGLKGAFFRDWLALFRRLGPEMAPQTE